MEPRQVWALLEGDARRWSRVAELVGWAVWLIVCNMPFAAGDNPRAFIGWLKRYHPPGFIVPRAND